MVCDAQWALSSHVAALNLSIVFMKTKSHRKGLHVTAFTHVSSIEADKLRDITAEPALVVDELLSMAQPATVRQAYT